MRETYTQDLQDITELKRETVEAQANELLREGWVLLGLFDRRDGNDQYVEYHLGKKSLKKTREHLLRESGL